MILAARKLCFSIFSSTSWRGSCSSSWPRKQLGVGGDPGERRVHLVRHAGGEQAHRRHLLGVLQLLLEPHARRDVVEDQDRAAALARARLEGRHREVHHLAAAVGRGQVQLVDVRDLVVVAEHERAAQRLEERLGEDAVERLAEHLGARAAVERLHRPVPAHHAALEVEHHDARVEALEDVLVVLLEPAQLVGLLGEAAVEPAVHDRGGRLRRERLQRVDLLAVERVEAVLAADAEDGDHLALARGTGTATRGPTPRAAACRRGSGRCRPPARPRATRAAACPSRSAAGPRRCEERRGCGTGRGRPPRRAARAPSRAARAPRRSPRAGAPRCARGRGRRSGPRTVAPAPCASCSAPCRRAGRGPPGSRVLTGEKASTTTTRAQQRDQRRVRLLPEHVGDARP